MKGKILLKQGNYIKSRECLEYAIQINPENPATWLNKANLLKSLEKFHEALLYYNKVLELDPANKKALKENSSILATQEKYEEALENCDKLIQCDKSNFEALEYKRYDFKLFK